MTSLRRTAGSSPWCTGVWGRSGYSRDTLETRQDRLLARTACRVDFAARRAGSRLSYDGPPWVRDYRRCGKKELTDPRPPRSLWRPRFRNSWEPRGLPGRRKLPRESVSTHIQYNHSTFGALILALERLSAHVQAESQHFGRPVLVQAQIAHDVLG